MARYKHIDTGPRLLPVDLARQLRPGTFEHALDHLIDHELDLSHFDARFSNDSSGAPAYPPAVLLKIVLFAYAQGILGSRPIARACQEQVIFIALCGDTAPHFTTIARFVAHLGDDIAVVFGAVLAICQRQGLIGGALFAVDGVKLPSNASKHRSGTRTEFERQATKLEAQARRLLAEHRTLDDDVPVESVDAERARRRVERLRKDAGELRAWLAAHPEDRKGVNGKPVKSNRTDNDSAKMATDKGVIQGYTAVAAVDERHQIIVGAAAHGTGAEQALLVPMLEAVDAWRTPSTVITADAGYYSRDNLVQLHARGIEAVIADNQLRKRDERFATQPRHRLKPDPLYDKQGGSPRKSHPKYTPADFIYDPVRDTLTCPAGKQLYHHGRACTIGGRPAMRFQGARRDCLPCDQRERCLRTPDVTATRQVALLGSKPLDHATRLSRLMRERIDSPQGRALYDRRFPTVEPVFGNIRHNKGLNRFNLRGRHKVNGQWLLYCLVHNIEKLANLRAT